MHESRDGELCHVEIFRKALSEQVIAETDEPAAAAVLRAAGFEEHRLPPMYRWYQLPPGLSRADENARATRATVLLNARGLIVDLDPDLHDPATETHLRTARARPAPPTHTTAPERGDGQPDHRPRR